MRPILRLILIVVGPAALVLGVACGGGSPPTSPLSRPGQIPTATPPANLPVPILLGQSQPSGPATPGASAGGNTYTVQSGDTLISIAVKLGVPPDQQASWVSDILRLNGIADASLLKVGQELTLPRVQATPRPTGTTQAAAGRTPTAAAGTPASQPTAAPTAASAPTARPTAAASGGAGTYTVVSGDSPVAIASKLGIPTAQQQAWADQLLSLNGVTASGLQVGQVLQLPKSP